MTRTLLAALVIVPLLGGGARAEPPREKERPVWPVPNPTFAQRGFQPTTDLRQISGVFGPRLSVGPFVLR